MALQLLWEFNGDFLDSSGNGRAGTDHGGEGFTGDGLAKILTSSGSYVSVSSTGLAPTNFTIKAKFKVIAELGVGQWRSVVACSQLISFNGYSISLYNGKIQAHVHDGAAVRYFPADAIFALDTWYTCHLVFDGTDIRFYINGVLQGSPFVTASYSTAVTYFEVGRWNQDNATRSSTHVDEVFVDDSPYSAAEVMVDYLDANTGEAAMTRPLPSMQVGVIQGAMTRPLPILSAGGFWCDYARLIRPVPSIFAVATQTGNRASMTRPLPSVSAQAGIATYAALQRPIPVIVAAGVNGSIGDVSQHRRPPRGLAHQAGAVHGKTPIRSSVATQLVISTGDLRIHRRPPRLSALTGFTGTIGNLVGGKTPIRSVYAANGFNSSTGDLVNGKTPIRRFYGRAVGVITAVDGQIQAIVVCLDNGVVTEYSNFPFNSFCIDGDVVIAASDSGLFLLEGDDDAGVDIDAIIETMPDDFGDGHLKRIDNILLGLDGSAMDGRLVWNNGYTSTQSSEATDEMQTKRIRTPKGIRQRYHAVELRNKAGAAFDLDAITLPVSGLPRNVNQ